MMTNPIPRLSANNAAFSMMNAADSLGRCKGNSKALEMGMVRDSFTYKASLAMEESQNNLAKSKTKRKLDIIA